jgi:CubicO group peptidase (beta-lactamase class C family)
MELREGWRCVFSEGVEARARLRDKANTNQHNLLCQAPPAPGNLTPSQGEGAMDMTPENLAAADRGQVWPHRVIRCGDAVRPLPPHDHSLDDLTFEVGDVRLSLSDYMDRSRTCGLLILKGGKIALERYGMGSGPERRQTSYSTAKSITATLVGAALYNGAIGSLNDRCDLYMPRLRGSAYEGVTVRNVLRMCSGVAWSELKGGQADVERLRQVLASRRPGSVLDLACSLPRAHPQGDVFNYSTVESCVLGAVLAAATGRALADYCAETIWGPAGMEANGYWALDAEGGQELGGTGVDARLRDVGRFGLLVMEDGEAFSGKRVLPPGWRDLAGQPDSAPTAFGRLMPGSPAGYGYHWWAVPCSPANVSGGAFSAVGAYGQRIFVNPAEQVVAAIQSAWRQPQDSDAEAETIALLRAAVCALRPDPGS